MIYVTTAVYAIIQVVILISPRPVSVILTKVNLYYMICWEGVAFNLVHTSLYLMFLMKKPHQLCQYCIAYIHTKPIFHNCDTWKLCCCLPIASMTRNTQTMKRFGHNDTSYQYFWSWSKIDAGYDIFVISSFQADSCKFNYFHLVSTNLLDVPV